MGRHEENKSGIGTQDEIGGHPKAGDIYTVGHSSLRQWEFLGLLAEHGVGVVVDVRSHPTSHWPWFRSENLWKWLSEGGHVYLALPNLGGWTQEKVSILPPSLRALIEFVGVDLDVYSKGAFPKQRIALDRKATNDRPQWTNQGLYDYSWYMATETFMGAVDALIDIASRQDKPVAIMCAESLWWKCHRSMISDYLAWKEVDSWHLQPKLTSHKSAIGDRLERYDLRIMDAWAEHDKRTASR